VGAIALGESRRSGVVQGTGHSNNRDGERASSSAPCTDRPEIYKRACGAPGRGMRTSPSTLFCWRGFLSAFVSRKQRWKDPVLRDELGVCEWDGGSQKWKPRWAAIAVGKAGMGGGGDECMDG
jgi:hypothetical protein